MTVVEKKKDGPGVLTLKLFSYFGSQMTTFNTFPSINIIVKVPKCYQDQIENFNQQTELKDQIENFNQQTELKDQVENFNQQTELK